MTAEPRWEPLHRQFERWAATDGDRPALTDAALSGSTMTYRDLNQAANRIARRLHAHGAGPGVLIGAAANRGPERIIAVLAILKTGAGYVPLDPAYPTARLRLVLDDCALRLIVGTADHQWIADLVEARFVDVNHPGDGTEPCDDLSATPSPDDTMYVIHTSGSTGRPKGVVVPHRCVTRLFTVTHAVLDIQPTDVWTALHSFTFDFSVWETWGALAHGGHLVVVPDGTAQDPDELWRLVLDYGVSVLNQTPTAFLRMMTAVEAAAFPPTALRLVIFGGERLAPRTLHSWVQAYGTRRPRLVNMYGITETTVHVTTRDLTHADIAGDRSPIGHPLADLHVHLLDSHLRPVPPQTTGEIYVTGPGVTGGYLGHPELTAQRFLPDPWGPPGARMYRTGDLAQAEPDGDLTFLRRADRQVQIRGFRVEPDEIEAALLAIPGVRQAAVVPRLDSTGNLMLVGYVTGPHPPRHLRTALIDTLPRHLIPAAIVTMPSLPLTAHGKVDALALPAPPSGTHLPPDSTAPTPHRLLTEIWAQVLDLPGVGHDDNFFRLGGDSMRAAAVVARCQESGLTLSVASLYRLPTIRQLAPILTTTPTVEPELRDQPPATRYPATAQQVGILYDCDTTADPALYRVLAAIHLAGPLDTSALRAALATLAGGHEALRSDFDIAAPDGPAQRVHAELSIPLSVTTAPRGLTPTDALRKTWSSVWVHRLDAEQAPLAHCHILRHADSTYHLVLLVHHAVVDGWSLALAAAELLTTYSALLARHPPPTREPTLIHRDTFGRERRFCLDPAERDYWLPHLTTLAPGPPPIPDGASNAATPDCDARAVVAADTRTRLIALARDLAIPMKSLFVAAQLWATAALTGHPTPATGVTCPTRPEISDAESLIGMYVNLLPLNAAVPDHPSWRSLIQHAFDQERDMLPHRWVPLAKLTTWHPAPLFHTVLTYTDFRVLRHAPRPPLRRLSDWTFINHTPFPICTEIHDGPAEDRLTIVVHSTTPLARRMAALLVHAITAMAESPDTPPTGLAIPSLHQDTVTS